MSNTNHDIEQEEAAALLQKFHQRFGMPHWYFACHAAFPSALTSDMLYRLGEQFTFVQEGEIKKFPWEAVADVLLNLCQPIGLSLFEMSPAVRKLLLLELKKEEQFGIDRLQRLSKFLLEQIACLKGSSSQNASQLHQAQRWAARVHVDPLEVARELALEMSIKPAEQKANPTYRWLHGQTDMLGTHLEGAEKNVFDDLKQYTSQLSSTVYRSEFVPNESEKLVIQGVELPAIPISFQEQIGSEFTVEQPEVQKVIQEAKTSKATELHLNGFELTSIPEEVYELKQLKILHLDDNHLTTIPNEIGKLKKLEELMVRNNQLEKIESGLGALPKLKVLSVTGNKIRSFPEEILKCRNLLVLSMRYNELAEIPTGLEKLKGLKTLRLSGNPLRGFPIALRYLRRLNRLDLEQCDLISLPEWLGEMEKLKHLDLSSNSIEFVPVGIEMLTRLQFLDLSENNFSHVPQQALSIESLKTLDLRYNPISDIPDEVLEQGVEAIRAYYESLGAETDYDFKSKFPQNVHFSVSSESALSTDFYNSLRLRLKGAGHAVIEDGSAENDNNFGDPRVVDVDVYIHFLVDEDNYPPQGIALFELGVEMYNRNRSTLPIVLDQRSDRSTPMPSEAIAFLGPGKEDIPKIIKEIEHWSGARNGVRSNEQLNDVFICYSWVGGGAERADAVSAFQQELSELLTLRLGRKAIVWSDQDLRAGDNNNKISEELAVSKLLLFLRSESALNSSGCMERLYAFKQQHDGEVSDGNELAARMLMVDLEDISPARIPQYMKELTRLPFYRLNLRREKAKRGAASYLKPPNDTAELEERQELLQGIVDDLEHKLQEIDKKEEEQTNPPKTETFDVYIDISDKDRKNLKLGNASWVEGVIPRLEARLEELLRRPINLFYKEQPLTGVDRLQWESEQKKAIESSHCFVPIVTQNYIDSAETMRTLKRYQKAHRDKGLEALHRPRIIPVVLESVNGREEGIVLSQSAYFEFPEMSSSYKSKNAKEQQGTYLNALYHHTSNLSQSIAAVIQASETSGLTMSVYQDKSVYVADCVQELQQQKTDLVALLLERGYWVIEQKPTYRETKSQQYDVREKMELCTASIHMMETSGSAREEDERFTGISSALKAATSMKDKKHFLYTDRARFPEEEFYRILGRIDVENPLRDNFILSSGPIISFAHQLVKSFSEGPELSPPDPKLLPKWDADWKSHLREIKVAKNDVSSDNRSIQNALILKWDKPTRDEFILEMGYTGQNAQHIRSYNADKTDELLLEMISEAELNKFEVYRLRLDPERLANRNEWSHYLNNILRDFSSFTGTESLWKKTREMSGTDVNRTLMYISEVVSKTDKLLLVIDNFELLFERRSGVRWIRKLFGAKYAEQLTFIMKKWNVILSYSETGKMISPFSNQISAKDVFNPSLWSHYDIYRTYSRFYDGSKIEEEIELLHAITGGYPKLIKSILGYVYDAEIQVENIPLLLEEEGNIIYNLYNKVFDELIETAADVYLMNEWFEQGKPTLEAQGLRDRLLATGLLRWANNAAEFSHKSVEEFLKFKFAVDQYK